MMVSAYAQRGRKPSVITLDAGGVTLTQGDGRRTWPWSDIGEPRLSRYGAGVDFAVGGTRADGRVLGDVFEASPRQLAALLREAKARWSAAAPD